MGKSEKYEYFLRPGYGSENLLIEFRVESEKEEFDNALFNALKEIYPKVVLKEDLWMNDETSYSIDSNVGKFELSKDIWGFAFIMAEENQACLGIINNLLFKDNRFEKIEVDSNDYKLLKDTNR